MLHGFMAHKAYKFKCFVKRATMGRLWAHVFSEVCLLRVKQQAAQQTKQHYCRILQLLVEEKSEIFIFSLF